jgi:U3 small nucleolar RNA-associated protein 19
LSLKYSRFLFGFPELDLSHVTRKLLSNFADESYMRKRINIFDIDMPGRVEGPGGAVKRKRVVSKHMPSKRSRSESSEGDVQARILLLETQIFESKKNYNNISTLIKLSRNEDENPDVPLVASIALCRIFSRLMASGDFIKAHNTTEKESVVTLWLRERYTEYKVVLLQLLIREASGSTALTLCMRMLKSEGTHLRNGQEYSFPSPFLRDIMQNLLGPDCGDAVRREFCEKYMGEHDDVRFYTFAAIE